MERSPLELKNVCYLGTSIESGAATAVVVATGLTTYLGGMSRAIVGQPAPTSFDRGVAQFTWLMMRFMIVMVPLVFVVNALNKTAQSEALPALGACTVALMGSPLGDGAFVAAAAFYAYTPPPAAGMWGFLDTRDWKGAFLFALAVAVGLTPEMLPMIVSVCLSKGAMAMSRKRVIVKRLNSIQNLGAMDILCTDKTGTLTMDHIILEKYCDVILEQDNDVLELAYLNSHFQTGLKNLLDRAILQHSEIRDKLELTRYEKVDEIPFDFSRKIMSVVVKTPENVHRLICKGAPEEVYRRCKNFSLDGAPYSIEHLTVDLKEEFDRLSSDGFRVLAIAYRDMPAKAAYSKEDEKDLILRGYLAFLDPPKDSARIAIAALNRHGVTVKVLTGDNELVSQKICKEVGIATGDADQENSLANPRVLLGTQVEKMSDAELTAAVETASLCARVSPAHKQRIIKNLQAAGHVVGFMGDGINDAPALRAADVGISVDTAVDIAKEAADVILLEKDLHVLEEGVIEGRKVFANILKYVRMGASSNFGNMFSVLGASIFLPFLPMLPIQILTNNLLYDLSQVPIPTDDVDPEQIAKPKPWSMTAISRFMIFIGPCSSVFDYTTFFMMLYVFGCWDQAKASLFQTGWFVESLLTQTLIIHVIRTNRIPFLQSWASWPVIVTTTIVMMIGICLPFSSLARDVLKFKELSIGYWPLLFLTLLCYVLLTQTVKMWVLRRKWILE